MITLITGLPGSGKTLFTVDFLRKLIEKESRPLFVNGLTDLKLPHNPLADDALLKELGSGAIWVYDESQRIFPPRSASATPPPNVRYMEKHRHQGHDGFLITQHPNLLDANVRRLVGRHFHVVRQFGMQRADLYEWPECVDPSAKASRSRGLRKTFHYPKDVFNLYKSAELHTMKRNIPKIIFALPVLVMVVIAALLIAYQTLKNVGSKNDASNAQTSASTSAQTGNPTHSYANAKEDAKNFVFTRTARVDGLPHTAPRYDEVTKPTTAPVPVACVASETKCRCYSQQATLIQTPEPLCRDIADKGFFMDFDDHGGKNAERPNREGSPVVRADAVRIPSEPGRGEGADLALNNQRGTARQ